MSKVSVLIAVYNTEKYLAECLDSVCSQTLQDIQIICIDDCSTDSSPEILQRYAAEDSRLHIIRMPENSGQAVARNKGLQIADGEYIMMLDSDDWLAPDAIERAYESITSADDIDCALFDLYYYYQENQQTERYQIRANQTSFSGEEAFILSLDWSLHGLYLVKASIHQAYPYDTSCRLYSDDNTTRLHYLHSRRVVLSDGVYYYRRHADSMTTRISIRRFDYMEANLSMKRTLLDESTKGNITNPDMILNKYELHRWFNLVDCYWVYYTHRQIFSQAERNEIEQRIACMLTTIERHRIPLSVRLKFGYYPFRSFATFAFIENCYFGLRKLIFRR